MSRGGATGRLDSRILSRPRPTRGAVHDDLQRLTFAPHDDRQGLAANAQDARHRHRGAGVSAIDAALGHGTAAARRAFFVSLAESGLGIAETEIARLFEPFVLQGAAGSAEVWTREVARRRRKRVRATARRLLLGRLPKMQRRKPTVLTKYDKAWQAIDSRT